MEHAGAWPVDYSFKSDEVVTKYFCKTESCRYPTSLQRIDGKGPVTAMRGILVVEPDLFAGPCPNPEYEWEISPRELVA
jgi:hypothetical protein